MPTDTEQKIYNAYLRALAEHHERPYKARRDFSKMREKDKLQLSKLRLFFEQYKDVNPFQFFRAGFKYELGTYPTLEYFNTLKATRLYAKHMRERYYKDVDNHESLSDFKDGILFIYNFIADNDLTLMDYKTVVNESGVPWVIIHLKRQNVSFYHIHALEIEKEIFPVDFRELITEEFDKVWEETKVAYDESKVMKEIGSKFNKFSHRLLKATKKRQNNDKMISTAGGTDTSSEV